MTEPELFPRGKVAAKESAGTRGKAKPPASSAEASKGAKTSEGHGGRKRKASGSQPSPAGDDKDWLFGAPQAKQTASGVKKPREKDNAGSSTGRVGVGTGKPGSAAKEVGSSMIVEQSGRGSRLEMVSFKKLNQGTLVLGVVFKVNENDMVVSLPSSLTGVVRRKEVSDHFYSKAVAKGSKGKSHRQQQRYFDGEASSVDAPLNDLFTQGQVVRCAIISLAKEVGGRHIELSLRASVLNKGLSLSQLSKGSGVFGSVSSVEDHGYVVSLGLEGVTAFLPIANAPEGGLRTGQPVEAVIQMVKAAARTITLSAEPSLVAAAVTKGTSFDLRSLKPGMLVDAMVDSVLSNGMLVTFLGYFAGCVDHNNMPVVSGDGKDDDLGWRSLFKPGPELIRARVLLVDYANKAVRLTLRPHLVDMRPPSGLPSTGELLEGEVVRVDPALGLLLKVPSLEGDGSDASTTGGAKKKVKGQARRERRSKSASSTGLDGGEEGVDAKGNSVGAYVHISRISDERVEHVERSYKPGQTVRCRITGSSLVEGWAAASLRPSVLKAAVLRYEDLKAGTPVEGEIAAVEAFGLLVKLGDGVRALVPKMHLADVTVKSPKTRFKVGARVKARVLTVDAGSSKATLTLKRSMLRDKRAPLTCYDDAKEGVACSGFVTKVASFGLHVSFYGNVFGLLPAKALTRHGIQEPSEAFSAGQVVGCAVTKCDVTTYPPKLSLALDVAGKSEDVDTLEPGQEEEDQDNDARVECPCSPGDIVTGVVSASQDKDGVVTIDLSIPTPPDGDKKTKRSARKNASVAAESIKGLLPFAHLGDCASICNETLAKKLTPGTTMEQLLVLEVDRDGVPVVSLKPLLISAVSGGKQGVSANDAFMPRESSDVSPGDLVAGFVSRVEAFGVFVKFLGRFSALCPRAMVADRTVEDPRGMFEDGDSVRCVVQRVDAETGRVVVSLDRSRVPPSPGLYLRSLLSETFAAASCTGDAPPVVGKFEFGVTTNAVVVAVKEYGVVLKASPGKDTGSGEEGRKLMVCPLEHAQDGVEEGDEVKVRVIGRDLEKGVLDVTMDTALVKAGRSKRRRAITPLDVGESVTAKVVLAKPDAKYAVLAQEGRLFVLQVADFHCPHRTNLDAGLCPSEKAEPVEVIARVGESFTPERQGYWEAQESGAKATGCNLYASAVLLVPEDDNVIGKKASRKKPRGDKLELGDQANSGGDVELEDSMKTGKVSLGNIVPGAQVVCEVMTVHWDRLDVKVAVRYPKTYGPRDGKLPKGRRHATADSQEDDQEDAVEEGSAKAASGETTTRKRRRDDVTNDSVSAADANVNKSAGSRKQIVRIRAKVHCTNAGAPEVDAPCEREGEADDGGGDDAATMPKWHPLAKFHVGQVLKAVVLHVEDQPQKKDSKLLFRLLELEVVGSREGGAGAEDVEKVPSVPWWRDCPPKRGEVHRGVVTEIADHGVLVSLSSSVRGLVPMANLSEDEGVRKEFRKFFRRGMGVRAVVRSVDGERRRLILSLTGVPSPEVLPDASLPAMSPGFLEGSGTDVPVDDGLDSPRVGDVIGATVALSVKPWSPPCLMVRLDNGGIARVCVTELADETAWKDNPLSRFKDGERVRCRVLPPHSSKASSKQRGDDSSAGSGPVELSLRQSRLEQRDVKEAVKIDDSPEVGSTAKCYVVGTGKSGCFVRLAGRVSGRVLLKLLSDRYVSNPAKEFPPGRLVAGKVLEKDEASGRVSLTLQASVVLDGQGGEGGGLAWSSERLAKGLKVKGRVAAVKDYGVFVQIDGSEVRGMCHRSQAAEKPMKDLTQLYDEGDLVKAIVLKVERNKKRLSLGLKPSYFEGDPDSSDEEDEDEQESEDASDVSSDEEEQSDSDQDESNDQDEGSQGDANVKVVSAMDVSDEDDSSAAEESEEEDSEEEERSSKRPRGVMEVAGMGGASRGASAFSLNFGGLGTINGTGASSDEDEDTDDDSDDAEGAGSKGHRSRKKAKERREEEERIVAKEKALLDEDAVPETAGDYERMIVATPNDSLLWVKYMAFKLSLADVEGARAVAERGLKAVSFREEQERFNLWVSLINLEHKFGSRATLKAVSERARQNSSPKKVYLHLAQMHEKAQESEECEEVFQAAVKKFRHSEKVWVAFQLSRLQRGDDKGAREVLQRSLQSLSRHKHVDVISRFAQNEFEHGSVERGRSVFEGLMASYPKRLDLWNVYVDKETKAGDIRAARNLLDRMTAMDFNAKRMKGVFKKFLQFEMDHGDDSGVDAVKAKATEYVASLS